MLPISAAELSQIRADIQAAAMDQACVVQRKTRTSDGGGSSSEVWTTIATVSAGVTQPSASLLQNYDYKISSLATWQVRLPYITAVKEQDRLLIGEGTLVVQVILAPRSYSGSLTILAAEVK